MNSFGLEPNEETVNPEMVKIIAGNKKSNKNRKIMRKVNALCELDRLKSTSILVTSDFDTISSFVLCHSILSQVIRKPFGVFFCFAASQIWVFSM